MAAFQASRSTSVSDDWRSLNSTFHLGVGEPLCLFRAQRVFLRRIWHTRHSHRHEGFSTVARQRCHRDVLHPPWRLRCARFVGHHRDCAWLAGGRPQRDSGSTPSWSGIPQAATLYALVIPGRLNGANAYATFVLYGLGVVLGGHQPGASAPSEWAVRACLPTHARSLMF